MPTCHECCLSLSPSPSLLRTPWNGPAKGAPDSASPPPPPHRSYTDYPVLEETEEGKLFLASLAN